MMKAELDLGYMLEYMQDTIGHDIVALHMINLIKLYLQGELGDSAEMATKALEELLLKIEVPVCVNCFKPPYKKVK